VNEKEQIDAFADDLDKLVHRYRSEFDLSYAAAVGVLQMKSWLLCSEAAERVDDL
jgi:hypothetical protein